MKAHLMYKNRDFTADYTPGPHEKSLTQDLELAILFEAMSNGDALIAQTAKRALFNGLSDCDEIRYRQAALADCLHNPDVLRELYAVVTSGIERKKKEWMGITGRYLSSILSGSVNMLAMFMEHLRELRRIADTQEGNFKSDAFRNLFAVLQTQLDDEYLSAVEARLKELRFRGGMLMSARIGKNGQGAAYVLRREASGKRGFLKWRLAPGFAVNPRDDSECSDLSRRKDRAINRTANALAQAADHVLAFFVILQEELSFYAGCLNLYEALTKAGGAVAFPEPLPAQAGAYTVQGLYDASLALLTGGGVVGNDIDAHGKSLLVVTGANQGGKSTFLRSAGQAQLFMQCGMFVPAHSYRASVASAVFTHFKKEEDSQKSGKLNEELQRMSDVVDELRPRALVLFNESFATTNEREGSEIGRQIVRALLERDVRVFFVSHFYDFARSFYEENLMTALFLRAERLKDGQRTFKLLPGEPLRTSYGEDIYKKIFGKDA